jgi:hypothetical protein
MAAEDGTMIRRNFDNPDELAHLLRGGLKLSR